MENYPLQNSNFRLHKQMSKISTSIFCGNRKHNNFEYMFYDFMMKNVYCTT